MRTSSGASCSLACAALPAVRAASAIPALRVPCFCAASMRVSSAVSASIFLNAARFSASSTAFRLVEVRSRSASTFVNTFSMRALSEGLEWIVGSLPSAVATSGGVSTPPPLSST